MTPKDTVEEIVEKHVGAIITACFYNDGTKKSVTDVIDVEIPALIKALHATEARVRKEMLEKDIEEMEGMKTGNGKPVEFLSDDDFINNTILHNLITQKKEALKALSKE